MAQNSVNLPGSFGGLMRYNEEYESIFNPRPSHIIGFLIVIVVFRIALGVFLK